MQKLSLDEATSSMDSTPTETTTQTQENAWQQPVHTHVSHLDGSSDFSQNRSTLGSTSGMERSMSHKPASSMLVVLLILAVGAGVATGFGGYKLQSKTTKTGSSVDSSQPIQKVAGDTIKNGQVFGIQDEKTFKDGAEGYLEEGGIGGEGSHKLLRAGGVSQTIVLTSSVTDLSKFVGMQVKLSGETFKAQKAGWLMDVGRVQVIDTAGKPPTEGE